MSYLAFIKAPSLLQMLMQWLDDNLTVSGASSFENGFDFAFSTLNSSLHRSNNNEERGGCNPVILLFTDGGAEYPDHTFEKWNDDKQVKKNKCFQRWFFFSDKIFVGSIDFGIDFFPNQGEMNIVCFQKYKLLSSNSPRFCFRLFHRPEFSVIRSGNTSQARPTSSEWRATTKESSRQFHRTVPPIFKLWNIWLLSASL